jgi:hypothetical protein
VEDVERRGRASLTQSFNTTTSKGRLTLDLPLAFA